MAAAGWRGNKLLTVPFFELPHLSGRRLDPFKAGACVDTQTKDRGPTSEQAWQPERGPSKSDSGKSSEGVGEPHEAQKPSLSDRLRQHWMLAAAAACIGVVAVIAGLLYWLDIRHYESTDDAFVAARSFSVASKVGGYVTEIR
jgi:membrane fusion protein (multidrug efflux system)